jgi:transcriptional regulator with XRE-family HTH domain
MGTAAHLRQLRVRAGKSARDVARHLGINDAWYDDLERHDDELTSTLTLFQAIELASVLGVRLHELLDEEAPSNASIALTDLPPLIDAHLARNAISLEQFEETLGWELGDFLRSPLRMAAESPLMFIQALALHLGLDWLSLVPDEHVD